MRGQARQAAEIVNSRNAAHDSSRRLSMSTSKKWSILLRVFLALVVAGVGVAGGYYL